MAAPPPPPPVLGIKATTPGGPTRRLRAPSPLTFPALMAALTDAYGGSPTVTWTDDEGDAVSLSSAAELDEALRVVEPSGVLRLVVTDVAPAGGAAPPPACKPMT